MVRSRSLAWRFLARNMTKLLLFWVLIHAVYHLLSFTWFLIKRCWWAHKYIRWFQFCNALVLRNNYLILIYILFLNVYLSVGFRWTLFLIVQTSSLYKLRCLYLTRRNHLIFLLFHSHCHTWSWWRSFITTLYLHVHTLTLPNCFCHISSSVQINVVWVKRYILNLFLRNIIGKVRFILCSILPKLVLRLVITRHLSPQIIISVLNPRFRIIVVATVTHCWCLVKLWDSILAFWGMSTNRWWFRMISFGNLFRSIVQFRVTHAVRNILIILCLLVVVKLIWIWIVLKLLYRLAYKALMRLQIWLSLFRSTLFWALIWKFAFSSDI